MSPLWSRERTIKEEKSDTFFLLYSFGQADLAADEDLFLVASTWASWRCPGQRDVGVGQICEPSGCCAQLLRGDEHLGATFQRPGILPQCLGCDECLRCSGARGCEGAGPAKDNNQLCSEERFLDPRWSLAGLILLCFISFKGKHFNPLKQIQCFVFKTLNQTLLIFFFFISIQESLCHSSLSGLLPIFFSGVNYVNGVGNRGSGKVYSMLCYKMKQSYFFNTSVSRSCANVFLVLENISHVWCHTSDGTSVYN